MIKVKQFQFSMFGVNTYLVIDTDTNEAAVIDPAMSDATEQARFDDYLRDNGIRLTQIINTHLHLDHCFGMDYVKTRYGVPVKAHPDDAMLGRMMDQQYQMFGMRPRGTQAVIDVNLADGDIINIGKSQLQVIHVPGHSQGGVALYDAQTKLLFAGDTIFHGSIGRTDLPGGNHSQLIKSIRDKILTLPDDVTILPGHNDATTIAEERKHNPYI